jgi:hypothetical protein
VLITVLILSVLALLLSPAAAAPMPLKVVVNHETKQCTIIIGGDECMECFPPEGWETIGFAHQVECPADYEKVEVNPKCVTFSDEFCGGSDSDRSKSSFKWLYGLIPAVILAAVIVFALKRRRSA